MSKSSTLLRDYLMVSLLAAGLMIAGISLFLHDRNDNPVPVAPLTLKNQPFRFAMGGGEIGDNRIEIQKFSRGLAIISSKVRNLDAKDFAVLKFSIHGQERLEEALFFARPREHPNRFIRIPLPQHTGGILNLRQYPEWQGTLSEIGFMVRGREETAYQIDTFSLEPPALLSEWRLLINGWLQFESWQQKSVNYTAGGAREQLLYLPAIIAGWFLLAISLYGLLAWLSGRGFNRTIPFALLLTGWLILDGRWLLNAIQQANTSISTYAGLTENIKLKQGIDSEIISYVEHLKNNVLPETPSKILLLTDSDSSQYFELKARYHLLPHSAYVSAGFPDKEKLVAGIYFLVLGLSREFGYSEESFSLTKKGGGHISLKLVDKGPQGSLYISH